MTYKFRVAICGGGIGGLSFALGLARYEDIEIHIYEAAETFKEIGAGISIWGRGLTTLRRLGLEEKARKIATIQDDEYGTSRFEIRRSDQTQGKVIGSFDSSTNFGFHRSQLSNLLIEELCATNRAMFHFNKRCVSFWQGDNTEGDTVTMYFADATTATCHVLVGCDGIKSAIRGHLLYGESEGKDTPDPEYMVDQKEHNWKRFVGTRFSGSVAYRSIITADEIRTIDPHHELLLNPRRKLYTGRNKQIVLYPVAEGRFINLVCLVTDATREREWVNDPWVCEAHSDELAAYYNDFEPEAQGLIKCVSKTSRWAMYDLEPIPFWSRGRVTLLGDAAHASTPFLGAGAGQVLEDAYILAHLLGSPTVTLGTLPSALKAYEATRKERATRVVLVSRESRRSMQFLDEYEEASDEVAGTTLNRLSSWLWEGQGDLDDDLLRAVEMVKKSTNET